MTSGQLKQGNVRLDVSIPSSLNDKLRLKCKKKGNVSEIVIEALEKYLSESICSQPSSSQ